jgi:hypothetical protein
LVTVPLQSLAMVKPPLFATFSGQFLDEKYGRKRRFFYVNFTPFLKGKYR